MESNCIYFAWVIIARYIKNPAGLKAGLSPERILSGSPGTEIGEGKNSQTHPDQRENVGGIRDGSQFRIEVDNILCRKCTENTTRQYHYDYWFDTVDAREFLS